jgi:hypothetical protein
MLHCNKNRHARRAEGFDPFARLLMQASASPTENSHALQSTGMI